MSACESDRECAVIKATLAQLQALVGALPLCDAEALEQQRIETPESFGRLYDALIPILQYRATLEASPVVEALWIRGSDVRDVGWYWWNHKGEMRAVQIAAVSSCEKQYDNKLYAKGGISVPINALDIKDGRWLGPLSIPPVPKGGDGE